MGEGGYLVCRSVGQHQLVRFVGRQLGRDAGISGRNRHLIGRIHRLQRSPNCVPTVGEQVSN